MSLVNYTPHAVVIFRAQASRGAPQGAPLCTIPSSGVIRLESYTQAPRGTILSSSSASAAAIPCVEPPEYYDLQAPNGFDRDVGGIIVSDLVAKFLVRTQRCRCAVYVPATGPDFVVRDAKGAIVGTTALERYQ